jgi:hypothetical protein
VRRRVPDVGASEKRPPTPAVDPATATYYVGALIPEGALVEVELDAFLAPPR